VAGGRKGRTSRLLALIIAQFVAFWLPWNVLSLVVEFDRTAVPVDLFRLLDLGLKVLAMAGSACVNPILYCWSNDNIRGELIASIRQTLERQVSLRPACFVQLPQDFSLQVGRNIIKTGVAGNSSSSNRAGSQYQTEDW